MQTTLQSRLADYLEDYLLLKQVKVVALYQQYVFYSTVGQYS